MSELAGDMNIMFENAKRYTRRDFRLYKNAVKLQKIMQAKLQELYESDESESEEFEDESNTTPRKRPPGRPRENVVRKRARLLYKTLMEYVHPDGRQLIIVFMKKPSRKLYPDYYHVISEPMDMVTIETHIRNNKYEKQDELLEDFKLMFNNCRQYNEEGSVIYEDANILERILMNKVKELGPPVDIAVQRAKRKNSQKADRMRCLYNAIRDFKDARGRQLALIFMKLPSKNEYPDYYEIIKNPMNMERIAQKLKAGQYLSLDDLLADFVLMFDNACKYNEPDSQLYKDALSLQRVALQTKLLLSADDDDIPNVRLLVQELLSSLFIAMYNHQDAEGRCYSDSMAELPEYDEKDGQKVRGVSLDIIKRRLDRGLYRRLDFFQRDVFAVFDRARALSKVDSQIFEDTVELQTFFVKLRNELCRDGELLASPALLTTLEHVQQGIETMRQERASEVKDEPEDEEDKKKESKPKVVSGYILYSAEVRKEISAKYPTANFGEISRLVGNEWKSLQQTEKTSYEEKAQKMNAELSQAAAAAAAEAAAAAAASSSNGSSGSGGDPGGPTELVYECGWEQCDWQFEEANDLIDHCNAEPSAGHVFQYAVGLEEFQCQWRNCSRVKKGVPPFPNPQRLCRHVKEVHIAKNNGRNIATADRSRNFMTSRKSLNQLGLTPSTPVSSRHGQEIFQLEDPADVQAAAFVSCNLQSPSAGDDMPSKPTPSPPSYDLSISTPSLPQSLPSNHSPGPSAHISNLNPLTKEAPAVARAKGEKKRKVETADSEATRLIHQISEKLTADAHEEFGNFVAASLRQLPSKRAKALRIRLLQSILDEEVNHFEEM